MKRTPCRNAVNNGEAFLTSRRAWLDGRWGPGDEDRLDGMSPCGALAVEPLAQSALGGAAHASALRLECSPGERGRGALSAVA